MDLIDTAYDTLGRVESSSNPYRSTGDATYGLTSFLYDVLDRNTTQCQPDNTATPSLVCVPQNSYRSWAYSGNVVTFTDENSNQWQRTSDGLGRLTKVLEPSATSASPTLTTNYTYTALDDLLSVSQLGMSGTDTPRSRSFTYDSLSRLVCASNPENSSAVCPLSATSPLPAGTTQYQYDADSNVQSKTDARGITTSFTYDALNRVLSKSYSDGTLSSCFEYDGGEANGKGHLVAEWTKAGACPAAPATGLFTLRSITGYDPMGRVMGEQQCTPTSCVASSGPSLGYQYDLACDPTTLTNNVGAAGNPLTIKANFDGAAHVSDLVSSWGSYPTCLYVLGQNSGSTCTATSTPYGYGPVGPLTWTHGSNLTVTQGYTNRLWVNSITATGQFPDPVLNPH